MREEWKSIRGYKGYYEASNLGRIRSLDRWVKDKNNKPMFFKGKLLSNRGLDKDGYVLNILVKSGERKTVKVHRIIAQTFLKKLKGKNQVNHIDGIKNNNVVTNLEWVNSSENQKHAIDKLKIKVLKGEEIGNSVLTEELVLELREVKRKYNYSYTKLQEMYGVNRSTIHLAVTGKNWSHIK